MMQNWSPFHQAGCSSLWTNQRPPPENSNCGEKQLLHWVNKYHKIWVGCCNHVLGLIRYESRMVPEHADTISTPENWLQNLFGLHRRCEELDFLEIKSLPSRATTQCLSKATGIDGRPAKVSPSLVYIVEVSSMQRPSISWLCGLHPPVKIISGTVLIAQCWTSYLRVMFEG